MSTFIIQADSLQVCLLSVLHLHADDRDQPGHLVPERRNGLLQVLVVLLALQALYGWDQLDLTCLEEPSC